MHWGPLCSEETLLSAKGPMCSEILLRAGGRRGWGNLAHPRTESLEDYVRYETAILNSKPGHRQVKKEYNYR